MTVIETQQPAVDKTSQGIKTPRAMPRMPPHDVYLIDGNLVSAKAWLREGSQGDGRVALMEKLYVYRIESRKREEGLASAGYATRKSAI